MLFKTCLKGFLIFLFMALLTTALAAPTNVIDNFDLNQANQSLLQINTQFAKAPADIKPLESAIAALTQSQAQAKKCVETTEDELNTVNQQLAEIIATGVTTVTPEAKFLQDKKNQLIAQSSACRLYILRSKETISTLNNKAHALRTRALLMAEPHFFAKLWFSVKLLQQLPTQFDAALFFDRSGLDQLTLLSLSVLAILLGIGVVIGIKLKYFLRTYTIASPATFYAKLKLAIYCVLQRYALLLILSLLLAGFFTVLGLGISPAPYLTSLSEAWLIFVILFMSIRAAFYPPKPALPLNNLPESTAKALVFRAQVFISLLLLGFIIYVLFQEQEFPNAITKLARTIFITVSIISLISIAWLIYRVPKLFYLHPNLRSMISLVVGAGLLAILFAEWLGYHGIVKYLMSGLALTLVLGFLAWLLYRILISALNALSGDKHLWQQRLHFELGIKKHEPIPELIWLKIVIYLLIWGGYFIFLLRIWGMSKAAWINLLDALANGFKVANVFIVPSQILFALLLFTFLSALTRWLRHRVMRHPGLEIAPGAREALAAIVGYIGFAVALVFSLLVAGVNFAGLAIIAGALSVGIGFGLQNIVNNFVSGIILLIERPIKPGDRIIVGGTEGYVKKISIRSTHIETPTHADVIVPNSELISAQVTNLMYRNFYSRIAVDVGVAYGSDTDLVKNVLLKIAKSHPAIISDYPANEPRVIFKEIGSSSLNFELSCLIRDVNEQSSIKSDLHFAIDKAFRQHGIEIAYPQQDVHIRDWPHKP